MKDTLSPKDLAQAIGVSESSIKRWIDDGVLHANRTPGGHRRVRAADAIRFVREQNRAVVDPAALGIADVPSLPDPTGEPFRELLLEALAAGDGQRATQLLEGALVARLSVSELCDAPLRYALDQLGTLWLSQEDGILVEHRATEICARFLQGLRIQQSVAEDAPAAVGCAGPGECHSLPSLMASIVLADEGYRAVNLGGMTPISSLVQACDQHAARIAWVAISRQEAAQETSRDISILVDWCRSRQASLVVGGAAARGLDLPAEPWIFYAGGMRELAAFGRGLRTHARS